VRAAEGAEVDQRRVGWQQTGDAVDLGHLEGLVHGHARQNAGQRLGDERLAGAGRAAHKGVVAARRSHFYGALDVLLAHDVGKVGGGLES